MSKKFNFYVLPPLSFSVPKAFDPKKTLSIFSRIGIGKINEIEKSKKGTKSKLNKQSVRPSAKVKHFSEVQVARRHWKEMGKTLAMGSFTSKMFNFYLFFFLFVASRWLQMIIDKNNSSSSASVWHEWMDGWLAGWLGGLNGLNGLGGMSGFSEMGGLLCKWVGQWNSLSIAP